MKFEVPSVRRATARVPAILSAMSNETWRDQWRSANHYLDEIRSVYSGAPAGAEHARRSVRNFFVTTHHLRDWLATDPSTGISSSDCTARIKDNLHLRICADIANGIKHGTLKWSNTGDLATNVSRADVTVHVGSGLSAHRFSIASGGANYDVLEVAEAAIEAWALLLVENDLAADTAP